MSDYSRTVTAILEKTDKIEAALPLRNEACRSRFFLHPHATSKVCLFLHGFTAGPYQFVPMGEAFFKAGYNVLIPRQPGHGQAGDWNSDRPPPLPTDPQVYQRFALEWLQIAQALGQQVIVGGLSSGATLTGWLALEYPQHIERTLLFAPYLSSKLEVIDWLVEILPFYFEWFNKDAPGNFGYDGFCIPALRLFLDMGQEILEQAPHRLAVPMFVVCSESDQVVNLHDQQTLFKAVLKHQPQSWYYCFDKTLKIHHRMLTQVEGNDYQDLVIILAKAYVKSELTWTQLQEIAHRMLQGQTFAASVQGLNLHQRVCPELSIIMANSLSLDRFKCLAENSA